MPLGTRRDFAVAQLCHSMNSIAGVPVSPALGH